MFFLLRKIRARGESPLALYCLDIKRQSGRTHDRRRFNIRQIGFGDRSARGVVRGYLDEIMPTHHVARRFPELEAIQHGQ